MSAFWQWTDRQVRFASFLLRRWRPWSYIVSASAVAVVLLVLVLAVNGAQRGGSSNASTPSTADPEQFNTSPAWCTRAQMQQAQSWFTDSVYNQGFGSDYNQLAGVYGLRSAALEGTKNIVLEAMDLRYREGKTDEDAFLGAYGHACPWGPHP